MLKIQSFSLVLVKILKDFTTGGGQNIERQNIDYDYM